MKSYKKDDISNILENKLAFNRTNIRYYVDGPMGLLLMNDYIIDKRIKNSLEGFKKELLRMNFMISKFL